MAAVAGRQLAFIVHFLLLTSCSIIRYLFGVKSYQIKPMKIYSKAETDSQIQKTNYWLPVGKGKGGGTKCKNGTKRYKLLYKIDKQQGYTAQHRKLQPLFCNIFFFVLAVHGLSLQLWCGGFSILLLQSMGSRVCRLQQFVADQLSCPAACGIFPDQEWNP